MTTHKTSVGASTRVKTFSRIFLISSAAFVSLAAIGVPEAHAARCTSSGGNWTCTHQERSASFSTNNGFGSCTGAATTRRVRWQVPEGTPPAGGWPVVFFYNGTVAASSAQVNPFDANASEPYGAVFGTRIFHELLDDPAGTGKKYAVIAAEAPTTFGQQFWDTNGLGPYSAKGDYCFLPDLFNEVSTGSYGPASQYNMDRRFAFGISSGGFNSSRMAVTFNSSSNWKALGIVSAAYATCSATCFIIPTLPANHPPTKFWHGTADFTVQISGMRNYYNKLVSQGIRTEKVEHSGGHAFTAHNLGATGIKAWFDRH